MTAPRHLWSGDWQRESAAAAEAIAKRRVAPPERAAAEPPTPPSRPSALTQTLRRLRAHPARGALLTAVAMLVSAAAGYAVVSSLLSEGGHHSSAKARAPLAAHQSPAGASAPAWLGVETTGVGLIQGATILTVVPGGPADAAGLEPGDVITAIDARPVQTSTDLESALAQMHPGEQAQIRYDHGPFSSTTQAILAARPAGSP